jgi:hypothetical protein
VIHGVDIWPPIFWARGITDPAQRQPERSGGRAAGRGWPRRRSSVLCLVVSRRQEVGPRAKGDGARQQPQAGRDGGGVRRLRGTVTAPAAADGRGLHGVRCEAGSRLLAAAASMCERRWSAFGRLRGAVLDATEDAAQRRPGVPDSARWPGCSGWWGVWRRARARRWGGATGVEEDGKKGFREFQIFRNFNYFFNLLFLNLFFPKNIKILISTRNKIGTINPKP